MDSVVQFLTLVLLPVVSMALWYFLKEYMTQINKKLSVLDVQQCKLRDKLYSLDVKLAKLSSDTNVGILDLRKLIKDVSDVSLKNSFSLSEIKDSYDDISKLNESSKTHGKILQILVKDWQKRRGKNE